MTILNAIQEAFAQIANGGPALTIIEGVADDYGLDADLLSQKFASIHGDPETLKERLDAVGG